MADRLSQVLIDTLKAERARCEAELRLIDDEIARIERAPRPAAPSASTTAKRTTPSVVPAPLSRKSRIAGKDFWAARRAKKSKK